MHDLLAHTLDLVGLSLPADLDYDPSVAPMAMLAALAGKTGVHLARLRSMILAGGRGWPQAGPMATRARPPRIADH